MSNFCWIIPFLLLPFLFQISASSSKGCPVEELQKCAEPLRALGVPLSKNLVRLLLQIPSPTKLRKSCQAYSSVMPCFHSKVAKCGNSAQREILRQLANALQFLCSPFSALHQSNLMAHRLCIGRILGQQTSFQGECQNGKGRPHSPILHQCREQCSPKMGTLKFACLIRTWLSEQNICLLAKMRAECGKKATTFYTQMQKKIFHPKFPLICAENEEGIVGKGKRREEIKNEEKLMNQSTPASIFVTSKKKKMKAKLSEIRFKFGGRTTLPMRKGEMKATPTAPIPTSSVPPKSSMAPIPTSSVPPKSSTVPIPLAGTSPPPPFPLAKFPLANKTQRRNSKKAVNLLVQSVPFILFPSAPSTPHSPTEGMFFAAPNLDGAKAFKAAKLVFFEVAPIDEQFKGNFQPNA